MNVTQKETMNRGAFLRSLSLGTSTLMAIYCMGTMTSCSTGELDPLTTTPPVDVDPATGNPTGFTGNAAISGGAINFTIDLTHATYAKLKTSGSYLLVGDLIVAYSTAKTYVALSKKCTHLGTIDVAFDSGANNLQCPAHGSEFSLTGGVEKGPAAQPLKAYKTALSTDGNTLTVTA